MQLPLPPVPEPSALQVHHAPGVRLESTAATPRTQQRASLSIHDVTRPFFRLDLSELIMINGVDSVTETALGELMDKAKERRPRTPTKTSTLIITGVTRVREYDLSDSD